MKVSFRSRRDWPRRMKKNNFFFSNFRYFSQSIWFPVCVLRLNPKEFAREDKRPEIAPAIDEHCRRNYEEIIIITVRARLSERCTVTCRTLISNNSTFRMLYGWIYIVRWLKEAISTHGETRAVKNPRIRRPMMVMCACSR